LSGSRPAVRPPLRVAGSRRLRLRARCLHHRLEGNAAPIPSVLQRRRPRLAPNPQPPRCFLIDRTALRPWGTVRAQTRPSDPPNPGAAIRAALWPLAPRQVAAVLQCDRALVELCGPARTSSERPLLLLRTVFTSRRRPTSLTATTAMCACGSRCRHDHTEGFLMLDGTRPQSARRRPRLNRARRRAPLKPRSPHPLGARRSRTSRTGHRLPKAIENRANPAGRNSGWP